MNKKSIREIETELKATDDREPLYDKYAQDSRQGVRRLLEKYRALDEKLIQERQRLDQMLSYEREYLSCGVICGVDEAGRGPLAGPVVAGAVILPPSLEILYLNDSKQLSPARRERLYDEIMRKAVAVGVGMAGPKRIDEINILKATYEAMRQAVESLDPAPDILLNDAVAIPGLFVKQVPIIKGDAKSLSIAAASVVAKVTRDRLMEEYEKEFPGYGFASHKGYGSQKHIEALKKLGPCPIHRRSFIGKFI